MPQDSIWFGFLAMIILLVVNGFFVAVGFAVVALRRSRVKELLQTGNPAAQVVSKLQAVFEHSHKAGALADGQHQLLQRSLKLPEYIIEQLMVPRADIDWIDIKDSNEEILKRCVTTKHSRLPVANGEVDEFVGIVQVQDILSEIVQGKPLDIDKHLRQPLFVPGGKSALLTLQDFKASQCGLGVVLDEFGGVRGLFTINDIVAAALGENEEILDDWAPQYQDVSDNEWVMEGTLPLEEFEEITGIAKFPEVRKPYHTLAGLILAVSQHIPSEGEVIKWDDVQFKVMRMDRYRLAEVKVKRARKGQTTIAAELEGSQSMTA